MRILLMLFLLFCTSVSAQVIVPPELPQPIEDDIIPCYGTTWRLVGPTEEIPRIGLREVEMGVPFPVGIPTLPPPFLWRADMVVELRGLTLQREHGTLANMGNLISDHLNPSERADAHLLEVDGTGLTLYTGQNLQVVDHQGQGKPPCKNTDMMIYIGEIRDNWVWEHYYGPAAPIYFFADLTGWRKGYYLNRATGRLYHFNLHDVWINTSHTGYTGYLVLGLGIENIQEVAPEEENDSPE